MSGLLDPYTSGIALTGPGPVTLARIGPGPDRDRRERQSPVRRRGMILSRGTARHLTQNG